MKQLTEEQVELVERYAAALKTLERLQHLLPDDADAEQAYIRNLEEQVRLGEEHLDEQSAQPAAKYVGTVKRSGASRKPS